MKIDVKQAEEAITMLVRSIGMDPDQEPYKGTPQRYRRFLEELFGDSEESIKIFPEEDYDGPISLYGHEAWSMCPHHLLPTKFTIDVTYIPKAGKVLGLSKLPRLVNAVIRREGPALQERMTQHICDAIAPYSNGVHIIVKGEHLCTKMRGVKTRGEMITEAHYVVQNTPSTSQ